MLDLALLHPQLPNVANAPTVIANKLVLPPLSGNLPYLANARYSNVRPKLLMFLTPMWNQRRPPMI